ncbi:HEAT repeat domain-containing protein, partial [Candidatus Poribacteria bacterium]|nr:HEAT repeat domain-containing protein [Candidatus Poribacteria bacterium]
SAALTLGRLGSASESVVPKLVDALDNADADVRGRAAWSLVTLGKRDGRVLDFLKHICENPKEYNGYIDSDAGFTQIDKWAFQALWQHAPSRMEEIAGR